MGELRLKQAYVFAELFRLALVIKREAAKRNLYTFYPEFENAYKELLVKYFKVNYMEVPMTKSFMSGVTNDTSIDEYISEIVEEEGFAYLDKSLLFDERVAIAKDLLEIDMVYRKKQQEYNANGLYIHYHTLMGFHRKLTDAISGVKTSSY